MSSPFRETAVEVLTAHSSYTLNKSMTRIRCNGGSCAEVLDTPDGESGAVRVFARHQAEQLPASAATAEVQAPVDEDPAPPADELPPAVDPEPTGEDPELEPEPESTDDLEAPPAKAPRFRRNTKALTATIAELKKGDRVRATFNTPRYGQFTVEGTVLKGGAGLDRNQLSVSGWYINLNERAAKALQDLSIIAVAGQHEFAIPVVVPQPEHVGIGG